MSPYTATCVSSYCFLCVLILLYKCRHNDMCHPSRRRTLCLLFCLGVKSFTTGLKLVGLKEKLWNRMLSHNEDWIWHSQLLCFLQTRWWRNEKKTWGRHGCVTGWSGRNLFGSRLHMFGWFFIFTHRDHGVWKKKLSLPSPSLRNWGNSPTKKLSLLLKMLRNSIRNWGLTAHLCFHI